MLAEAGDPAPASGERFHRIVSVRKLRARLGAGNSTVLSRALDNIAARPATRELQTSPCPVCQRCPPQG
jgi:hypothetical protein